MIEATEFEDGQRIEVLSAILEAIKGNRRVMLPDFDPATSQPSEMAMLSLPPNVYRGNVSGYVYQFEGEDDLLHLAVTREDGGELTAEEGQSVASYLLKGVPPAMIWLRPGHLSQHFYLGHEELATGIQL
jgi:hypothetical protein